MTSLLFVSLRALALLLVLYAVCRVVELWGAGKPLPFFED